MKKALVQSLSAIDTHFDFRSDAGGGDPDIKSPTLRTYHRLLWSKSLPSGEHFDLRSDRPGYYLYHNSALGSFSLGSDAITHSYRKQARKKWLTTQIPEAVEALLNRGCTIGAYTIFPNKQIDRKQTINQARGVIRLIDDRFDLTLECIRRFYTGGEPNPLAAVLDRYGSFFRLFETFEGYVDFFLLQDLVDERGAVKFYLPFDDFQSEPEFKSVEDYFVYKDGVEAFINSRAQRIRNYVAQATA